MTKFWIRSIPLLGAICLFVPPNIAILCYDCVHSAMTEDLGLNTTCPDPFEPSGITTCSAANCMIGWADLKTNGYIVYRSCVAGQFPTGIALDKCEMLNQLRDNYRYFVYQQMCCNQSMQAYNYSGMAYNFLATSCICNTNNCNGAIPNYVTKKPSSTLTPKDPVTSKTTAKVVVVVTVVPIGTTTVKPTVKNLATGVVFQSVAVMALAFAFAVAGKVMP